MKRRPQQPALDAELESLIQEHLGSDEVVRGALCRGDEASVRLIARELHERLQHAKMARIRHSGCGRTLSFKKEEGRWCLVSEGFWIV